MRTALVGYTGFVGSNLAAAHPFDENYNSSNIADADGESFDLVVVAAARAEKWRINQDPEKDAAELEDLKRHLAAVRASRVVLISTVDVYESPHGVDERTLIDPEELHPYGRHRYELERFVAESFPLSHIVRLPGLFGDGLKKNVIFDLLHNNGVDRINAAGEFQYYNLDRLWRDIVRVIDRDLQLLNIATAPIATSDVALEILGRPFTQQPEGTTAPRYDFRSVHAELWGGRDGYLYSREQVLDDLRAFLRRQTR